MSILEMRYGHFALFFTSGKAEISRFSPGPPSRVALATGKGGMATTEDVSHED